MDNELRVFENVEFGSVRTVEVKGEVYFVGKDVAEILGYERAVKAILDHVDEEDKDEIPIRDSIGRMQKTPIINESGLYSLVLSSKLPNAKKFKRWVTSEVLPSIRKNGGYISGQETMSDDELLAKALMVAQNKIAERDRQIAEQGKQIEAMKPSKVFADAVATSKTSILIGELAKILKQNGVETGEKRLFTWLRDKGYLISRKGTDYNAPTQRSMEMKLFEVKETAITHSDGHVTVSKTTKVTGKGQQYFINKFLNGTEDKEAS